MSMYIKKRDKELKRINNKLDKTKRKYRNNLLKNLNNPNDLKSLAKIELHKKQIHNLKKMRVKRHKELGLDTI